MAEIVKARDTTPPGDRVVAIKRILPHLCDDQQYKAMFLDESRVLAQLNHPSIIHAFEIGEIDGTPYIALEFVEGHDGRELFHEVHAREERIPIGIACYIVARVCEGLHHAHEQTDREGQLLGIVHRDVSLQNILLSYDGEVKLTDFGIAVSAANVARTEVGVVKGKFGYMSPEQIKGAALDRRSDVFAAGICLFELLTGERLFSGESDYKAVERVRNVDVPRPSSINRQIPSSLEQVVMKALAKQPRDRYQSTNDLRRALQSFMSESREVVERADLGAYVARVFAQDYAATQSERGELRAARVKTDAQVTVVQSGPQVDWTDDSEKTTVAGPEHAAPDPWQGADAATGLLAFNNLPRPSTWEPEPLPPPPTPSAAPPNAPSVPPIIPRRESIPPGVSHRPAAAVQAVRFEMDWDEEEEKTTVARGFEGLPIPAVAQDDERTRPLLGAVAELKGASAISTEPVPRSMSEAAMNRALPTLEIPVLGQSRQALWLAAGLCALALGLLVYVVRDRGGATLKLSTDPSDARITIDGHVQPGASPYVIHGLSAGVNHNILVEKAGYLSWGTRLPLHANRVFELPLIKLEPLAPAPPVAAAQLPDAVPREPLQGRVSPAAISDEPPERPSRTHPRAASHHVQRERAAERPLAHEHSARASASRATGALRINSRPWSQISVDGRPAGNTPQMNLPLSAGTHKVTLRNPEFGVSKTFTVDIKAGETVTRVMTLVQ